MDNAFDYFICKLIFKIIKLYLLDIMILKIKVKPNSNKQEIEKIDEENYKISLKSKPEDNKANIELIKLLKKHFEKDIKIIKGLRNRNKIVEVKCQ
jgi:uncharacterized protein (TIGR00251 family)